MNPVNPLSKTEVYNPFTTTPVYNPFVYNPSGSFEFDVNRRNFAFPDEYGQGINAFTPESSIQAIQALNQPMWDSAYRMLVGGVHKGLVGAAEMGGYLIEGLTFLDSLRTGETWVDNSMVHAIRDYKKDLEDKYKIYESGTWNWDGGNFVFKSLQSLIEMATEFGVPGGVVGKAVGLGTKGLRGYRLFDFLNNRAGKQVTDAFFTGMASNYMEGKMMGLEKKEQLMEQMKGSIIKYAETGGQEGISFDDANKIATDAGIGVLNTNRILMFSDMLTFGKIFKGLSGATRNTIPVTFGQAFKKYGKDFLIEGLKEGGEEFIQGLFEREAEYKALTEFNKVTKGNTQIDIKLDDSFASRMYEYMKDGNLWYEGFLGVFGGLPQKAMGAAVSRIGNNNIRQQRQHQQQTIAATQGAINTAINQYGAATAANQAQAASNAAQQAATQTGAATAATAGQQTAGNQPITPQTPVVEPDGVDPSYTGRWRNQFAEFTNTAYNHFEAGTTDYLEKFLKDLASLSAEEAQAQGITNENYSLVAKEFLNVLPLLEKSFEDAALFKYNRRNIYLTAGLMRMYKKNFADIYDAALDSKETEVLRKLNQKAKNKGLDVSIHLDNAGNLAYSKTKEDGYADPNEVQKIIDSSKSEFDEFSYLVEQTTDLKKHLKQLEKELRYLRSNDGQKEGKEAVEFVEEFIRTKAEIDMIRQDLEEKSNTPKPTKVEEPAPKIMDNPILPAEENKSVDDRLDRPEDTEVLEQVLKNEVGKLYTASEFLSRFNVQSDTGSINKDVRQVLIEMISLNKENNMDISATIIYNNGQVKQFEKFIGVTQYAYFNGEISEDSADILNDLVSNPNDKPRLNEDDVPFQTPRDLELDLIPDKPKTSNIDPVVIIKDVVTEIKNSWKNDPDKRKQMQERINAGKEPVNFMDVLDSLYKIAVSKNKHTGSFLNKVHLIEYGNAYIAYKLRENLQTNPSALLDHVKAVIDAWNPQDFDSRSESPEEFTPRKARTLLAKISSFVRTLKDLDIVYLRNNNPVNAIAYLSKEWLFTPAESYSEDRRIELIRTEAKNELKNNSETALHDIRVLKIGQKVTFKVLHDYDGYIYTPVEVLNKKGEYKKLGDNNKKRWKTFAKEVGSGSEKYIEEVPIAIMTEIDGKEVQIGFVHNVSWMNERNIINNEVNNALDYVEQSRSLRQLIFSNPNFESKITNIGTGALLIDMNKHGEFIFNTTVDNLPDKNIQLAIGKNNRLYVGKNSPAPRIVKAYNDSNFKEDGDDNFQDGVIYALLPVENKRGNDYFAPAALYNKLIADNKEISNSIISAIQIYYKTKDSISLTEAETIFLNKLKANKYDVTNFAKLQDYLKLFLFPKNIKGSIASYNQTKQGSMFISAGNGFRFYSDGLSNVKKLFTFNINDSQSEIADKIKALENDGFNHFYFNFDINQINSKSVVPTINNIYSYNDYVKNSTDSYVYAIDISEESDTTPNWIYNVQRVIHFDAPVVKRTEANSTISSILTADEMEEVKKIISESDKDLLKNKLKDYLVTLESLKTININEINEFIDTIVKDNVVPTNNSTVTEDKNNETNIEVNLTAIAEAGLFDDPFFSPQTPTIAPSTPKMDIAKLDKIRELNYSNLIPGVSPQLQREVYNFLMVTYIQLIKSYGLKTDKQFKSKLIESFKENTIPKMMSNAISKNPDNEEFIKQDFSNLLENFDKISNKITVSIESFKVDIEEDETVDLGRTDWSDENMLTQDQRRKLFNKTKLMLYTIPLMTVDSDNVVKIRTNEYGLPVYLKFQEAYDVMVSTSLNINGNFAELLETLYNENKHNDIIRSVYYHFKRHLAELNTLNSKATPQSKEASEAFLKQFKNSSNFNEIIKIIEYFGLNDISTSLSTSEGVTRLKTNYFLEYDEFIKDIMSSLKLTPTNMIKVLADTEKGTTTVINSNAADTVEVMLQQWSNTMLTKIVNGVPMFTYDRDTKSYIANKELLKNILLRYNKLYTQVLENASKNSSLEAARAGAIELFQLFGISLEESYVRSLGKNKLSNIVLNLQQYYVMELIDKFNDTSKDIVFNLDMDVYRETFIRKVAKDNAKFTNKVRPRSHRDGSKNIWEYAPTMLFTDVLKNLKTNFLKYKDRIDSSVFSSGSYLLSDELFKKINNVTNLTTSLNPLVGEEYSDKKLDQRDLREQELYRINVFATKGGFEELLVSDVNNIGLKIRFRNANHIYLTTSDKTRVVGFQDIMVPTLQGNITLSDFDLSDPDLVQNLKDNVIIDDNYLLFYFTQVVLPEFRRMKHILSDSAFNPKTKDKAQWFYFTPSLNKHSDGIVKYTEAELISAVQGTTTNSDLIQLGLNIKDSILNNIYSQAAAKFNFYVKNNIGVSYDDKSNTLKLNGTINKHFIEKFTVGSKNNVDTLFKTLIDYEFASQILNVNTYQLVSTDIMNYNEKPPITNIDRLSATFEQDLLRVIKYTFENAGKRLSRDITPGFKHFNSGSSNRTVSLLILPEPKVDSKLYKEYKTLLGKLSAAYEDIKAADGQGYVDWKHYLDFLNGVRKIRSSQYKYFYNKLSAQENDIETYGYIKDENKLSDADLKKFLKLNRASYMPGAFSPQKPVGTVNIWNEKRQDFMPLFLKQSDLVLIPQLTAPFEIDNLRRYMMKGEKVNGVQKRIDRASYPSAIKIDTGYPAAPDSVFDEPIYDNNGNTQNAGSIIHNIPLEGIKFQQDSPYKDEKSDIRRVSQVMILALAKIKDKIDFNVDLSSLSKISDDILGEHDLNKGKFDGRDLYNIYNRLFGRLFIKGRENIHSKLKSENGLNIKAVKKLLIREAIDRGYDEKYVEYLKGVRNLSELKFTSYADSTESLLQSILTNKIINIKFPGYSSAIASNNKFSIKKNFFTPEQAEKYGLLSNIIWTSNFNGEDLLPKPLSGLGGDQIIVTNFFRDDNGNIIDLWEKGADGNYLYVTQTTDGRLLLNEDIFSKEMLEQFSMRIPNAGYNSSSKTEIVGILPTDFGTLAIATEDLIARIGHDFDLDKLYNYYKYASITTYKDKELEKRLEDFKNLIATNDVTSALYFKFINLYQEYKKYSDVIIYLNDEELAEEFSVFNTTNEEDLDVLVSDVLENYSDYASEELLQRLQNYADNKIPLANILEKTIEELRKELSTADDQLEGSELVELFDEIIRLQNELATKKDIIETFSPYNGDDEAKLIKNAIISIYQSIYDHPEMQKDIRTPTSYGDGLFSTPDNPDGSLVDLAETIYSIYSTESLDNFNGISAEYQRYKYADGTGAKGAVGVFAANNVVSSILYSSDASAQLYEVEEFGYTPVILEVDSENVIAGRISSSAKLLDRNNATLQLVLDNEKLQAAHKLNINNATYGVIQLMLAYNYGAETFLLINQYGTRRLTDYINSGLQLDDAFNKVATELLEMLTPNDSIPLVDRVNSSTKNLYYDLINTNYMLNANSGSTKDEWVLSQLHYIRQFALLDQISQAYGKIGKVLGVSSKSVGKNIAESIGAYERYKDIVDNNGAKIVATDYLSNTTNIYGIFGLTNLLLKEKKVTVGNETETFLYPNVIPAYVFETAFKESLELWQDVYEYQNLYVPKISPFRTLLARAGVESNDYGFSEKLKALHNDYISYLYTSQFSKFFNGRALAERRRLMTGIPGSVSVAKVSLLNNMVEQSYGETYQSTYFFDGHNLRIFSNEYDYRSFVQTYKENYQKWVNEGKLESIISKINSNKDGAYNIEGLLFRVATDEENNPIINSWAEQYGIEYTDMINIFNKHIIKAYEDFDQNSDKYLGEDAEKTILNIIEAATASLEEDLFNTELESNFEIEDAIDQNGAPFTLDQYNNSLRIMRFNFGTSDNGIPNESIIHEHFNLMHSLIGKGFQALTDRKDIYYDKLVKNINEQSYNKFVEWYNSLDDDKALMHLTKMFVNAYYIYNEELARKIDFYTLNNIKRLDVTNPNNSHVVLLIPYIIDFINKADILSGNIPLSMVLSSIRDQNPSYYYSNPLLSNLILSNGEDGIYTVNINSFSVEPEYDAVIRNTFYEMIVQENQPVLTYANNMAYTPRKLAQELISYVYINGGIQKAKELVKYVPLEYLNSIGFFKKLSRIDSSNMNHRMMVGVDTFFTEQAVQHDPKTYAFNVFRFAKQHNVDVKNIVVPHTQTTMLDPADLRWKDVEIKNSVYAELMKGKIKPLVRLLITSDVLPVLPKYMYHNFKLYKKLPDSDFYAIIPTLGKSTHKEFDAKAAGITVSIHSDNNYGTTYVSSIGEVRPLFEDYFVDDVDQQISEVEKIESSNPSVPLIAEPFMTAIQQGQDNFVKVTYDELKKTPMSVDKFLRLIKLAEDFLTPAQRRVLDFVLRPDKIGVFSKMHNSKSKLVDTIIEYTDQPYASHVTQDGVVKLSEFSSIYEIFDVLMHELAHTNTFTYILTNIPEFAQLNEDYNKFFLEIQEAIRSNLIPGFNGAELDLAISYHRIRKNAIVNNQALPLTNEQINTLVKYYPFVDSLELMAAVGNNQENIQMLKDVIYKDKSIFSKILDFLKDYIDAILEFLGLSKDIPANSFLREAMKYYYSYVTIKNQLIVEEIGLPEDVEEFEEELPYQTPRYYPAAGALTVANIQIKEREKQLKEQQPEFTEEELAIIQQIKDNCFGTGPVKAKDGLTTKFTAGSKWSIEKDLKGYPSHEDGGIDLNFGDSGVSFARDGATIMAANGLVLPAITINNKANE